MQDVERRIVLSGSHTKEQLLTQRPDYIVDNIMDIKIIN